MQCNATATAQHEQHCTLLLHLISKILAILLLLLFLAGYFIYVGIEILQHRAVSYFNTASFELGF